MNIVRYIMLVFFLRYQKVLENMKELEKMKVIKDQVEAASKALKNEQDGKKS